MLHDSAMELLPDELWSEIFCLSTKKETGLGARDLCALAVVCKRSRRISSECKVWWPLVERDFSSEYNPSEESQVHAKTLYRTKHEKRKAKRDAERRRKIMKLRGSIHTSICNLKAFEKMLEKEKATAAGIRERLSRIDTISLASLSLQRWTPQAVRTHHERVLEQVPSDAAAEMNFLKLDLMERCHCIATCQDSMERLEKWIRSCQDELDELSCNSFNIIGTSLSKGKVRKRFSFDCLGWRQIKRPTR